VSGDKVFGSIVCGTDFTACSAVALGQAIRIAGWSGAALHVVHVIDTVVIVEIEKALSPQQKGIREGLTRDAEKAWREFAAGVPGASALPFSVVINNRIVGILQRARESRADLLVMGAFGDRKPDVGLGTVASACVRKSTADVLLVRDTQAGPFQTVVAAVDFSPTSARVLDRGASIAARDGAELHVLYVFEAPWYQLHYRAPTLLTTPDLQNAYRASLQGRLEEFAESAVARHRDVRVRYSLFDYSGPRSGIAEYAGRINADLIVLGTRGRSNLRDTLLGSTAEKTLASSSCSVLAVKPEGFEHPLAAADDSGEADLARDSGQ